MYCLFSIFLYGDETDINIKLRILTVQFSVIKYIHNVVQSPLLSISRTFSLSQPNNNSLSLFSPILFPTQLFVSVYLPIVGTSQGNHSICYVWLISLSQMSSGFIHTVACIRTAMNEYLYTQVCFTNVKWTILL